jgi:hypothetical protein
MLPRSPSEYFIKFLLSKQEHTPEVILRMLTDFGLEGISVAYIKKLDDSMDPYPDPYDPIGDAESKAFLKRQGIHDLWFPLPHVQEAYKILSSPDTRSDLEQLLLSPLRIEDIVTKVNSHKSIKLTVEGVQAFAHYFWNKKLLTMGEWMEYLRDRPMAEQRTSILRVSPDMAQALVPWLAGLSGPPITLNTGTVSRRMRDIAFLKVLEIEHQPATLAHSKMMKNYMDVITAGENEMRQSDVALKDVLAAFDKFRLRKDDARVQSIEEVAGLNYSKSGEGTDVSDNILDEMRQYEEQAEHEPGDEEEEDG